MFYFKLFMKFKRSHTLANNPRSPVDFFLPCWKDQKLRPKSISVFLRLQVKIDIKGIELSWSAWNDYRFYFVRLQVDRMTLESSVSVLLACISLVSADDTESAFWIWPRLVIAGVVLIIGFVLLAYVYFKDYIRGIFQWLRKVC